MKTLIRKYKSQLFPFLDQGIVSGGNFMVGILLARTLGLETYGEFTLGWLVVLFCSSIHQAGIISPMYTLYPKQTESKKLDYFTALWLYQLVFGALAFGLTWLVLEGFGRQLLGWDIEAMIPWIACCVFYYTMYDFFRRSYYALGKTNKAIVLDAVVYGVQFVGLIGLSIVEEVTLKNVFILLSAAYGTSMIFGALGFSYGQLKRSALQKVGKAHWRFSKWLLATALLQWTSGNFFILAAASLLSPLAVGSIRIMQNIIGLLHVLFLAIENYVPIRASAIFQKGGVKQLGIFLRQITWKGGVITLLLAFGIAVFGETIVALLYEGKYTDQAYLLYGFAILYLFVFIGTNYRFAIRTIEQTQAIFIAYLWSTGFSLLFAKPIIQAFGLEGIIVGLIGTQLIMQLYFIYSLRTKLNLFWK